MMMRASLIGALVACVSCAPNTTLTSLTTLPGSGGASPQSDLVRIEPGPVLGSSESGPVVLPVEAVGGAPAPLVTPGAISITAFEQATPVAAAGAPVPLRLDISKASWSSPNMTVTAAIVLRNSSGTQEGEVYRTVRLDQRSLSATISGPTARTAGTKTVELRLLDPRSNQEVARAAPIQVTVGAQS